MRGACRLGVSALFSLAADARAGGRRGGSAESDPLRLLERQV